MHSTFEKSTEKENVKREYILQEKNQNDIIIENKIEIPDNEIRQTIHQIGMSIQDPNMLKKFKYLVNTLK